MSAMRDLSGKNYKDYSYCLTGKLDLNLSVRMYGNEYHQNDALSECHSTFVSLLSRLDFF